MSTKIIKTPQAPPSPSCGQKGVFTTGDFSVARLGLARTEDRSTQP